MGYADLTTVKQMLGLTGTSADARLTLLDDAVSALLDDVLGRTYGAGAATAETRVVFYAGTSDLLALPQPLRSLTTIAYGGTWDGSAWDGEDTLTSDEYELRTDTRGDIWGIRLHASGAVEYRITGVWADQVQPVPDAIAEAAAVLVAGHYKRDEAGPSGNIIGPDEMPITPSNPWQDERVKRAIHAYRVPEHVL